MKEYCKEGYIFVFQDVRGKWMSEGEFVDVRPFNPHKKGSETDEASDVYDTVEQLLRLIPNNNGRVGVMGTSYPGFYALMAAASNHPAIKAVSPQAPVTNWFIGDDFHHNGAFFLMDAFDFYSALGRGFGLPHPKPTMSYTTSVGFPHNDAYRFYLEAGNINNITRLTGDSIKFWNDMMQHPDYDDFWLQRDARNATADLQPAMLWVGGLFDAEDCWGAWHAYMAAEKNTPDKAFNRIIEGPWWHGQWSSHDGSRFENIRFGSNTSEYYQKNFEVPFFNYFLKDKGDVSGIAEANIFVTGSNEWRRFDTWPPADMETKDMYLNAGSKLSFNKPSSDSLFTSYISDPAKPVPYEDFIHSERTKEYMVGDRRFAAQRPDVIVFRTDILSEDITVLGTVTADLKTSISTTDADFVVTLIDVFPDTPESLYEGFRGEEMSGFQFPVRSEVFRGRYRKSFSAPTAFVPDSVEEVRFDLPPTAHCFKRGHRIMVHIQSSWFPLVDRNPQQFVDIYHCGVEAYIKSEIRIFHNTAHASKIVLPVKR
jgi:putative CocE/NonD family hydrolase